MIRHILRIIWNERKINAGIVLEFIVVFCVLWFCCDFLYAIGKTYYEDQGYDINQTYLIKMGKRVTDDTETTQEEFLAWKSTFTDRVKHYPGVEHLSFSFGAIPYSYINNTSGYKVNSDSTWVRARSNAVTPEFFDVFRIPILYGRNFNDNDAITQNNVIISPQRNGLFGEKDKKEYRPEDIKTIGYPAEGYEPFNVIGVAGKMKTRFFQWFNSCAYAPLSETSTNIASLEIAIRISPEAEKGFVENFTRDMKEQLFIGPYFLVSVTPFTQIRDREVSQYVSGRVNSTIAITGFLLVNIFLGIIGTFWSRTQSRRSEIGLRIALGSSRQKVKWMLFAETFIMLLLSAIVGIYICINLGQSEIIESLGIPTSDRALAGIGAGQDFIIFLITFTFMTLVSFIAVWYPARQSAKIAPAEALRDE